LVIGVGAGHLKRESGSRVNAHAEHAVNALAVKCVIGYGSHKILLSRGDYFAGTGGTGTEVVAAGAAMCDTGVWGMDSRIVPPRPTCFGVSDPSGAGSRNVIGF
jgi:hypothetical protein